jgi:hypothetical protein
MRTRFLQLAAVIVVLVSAATLAVSQQNSADQAASSNYPTTPNAAKHYYRLNYVLRETDEGKLLNQRAFVVTINSEATNAQGEVTSDPRWWSLRAGTRVPFTTGSSEGSKYSYVDVGVNLDSRGYEASDAFQLEVSAEISSLGAESTSLNPPVIRQLKVRSAVAAPFGKSTQVFTADDPASKHRFELDVTPVRE